MKDKENTSAISKRKKIVYSVILAVCVLLLVAAAVLTAYFVTNSSEPVLENPPADDPNDPNEPSGPSDPTGPEDPNEPSGPSDPTNPEDPNDPTGGNERVAYVSPVEAATCSVGYYEIYNNATLDNWTRHVAMDFAAEAGTPVRAMNDGTVVSVSMDEVLGNVVEIEHEGGMRTLYRFLEPAEDLRVGDKVTQGQQIGKVASDDYGTEAKDGPHLHLEMKLDGKHVDPADYIDATLEEK